MGRVELEPDGRLALTLYRGALRSVPVTGFLTQAIRTVGEHTGRGSCLANLKLGTY